MNLLDIQPESILVRSTNWVGDAVMLTPSLEAIRRRFPQSRISILTKPWVRDIFRHNPHIDAIIDYQDPGIHKGILGRIRLAGELKQKNFDLSIIFPHSFESALIAFLARIPTRVGYNTEGRSILLSHPIRLPRNYRKVHQSQRYMEMLSVFGINERVDIYKIYLEAHEERWAEEFLQHLNMSGKKIGIAPGAAYGPAKCWPHEYVEKLCLRIYRENLGNVLVFGGKDEKRVGEQLERRCGAINLAGKFSLRETISLIHSIDLLICNDSGLMHVGSAVGTYVLAIFGSTSSVATGPLGRHVTVLEHELPCKPCFKRECPLKTLECMRGISVNEVYTKLKEILFD